MRAVVRWLMVAVSAVAAAAALPQATAPGTWCAGQTLVMFCDDFDPPQPGWATSGNGAQTGTGSTALGFAYNPNDWHQSSRGCTDGGAKYVGVSANGTDAGYLSPQPFGLFLGTPPNWYQVRNVLASPNIDARGISLDSIAFKLKGSSEGTSNPPFDYLDVFVDVLGGPTTGYGRYSGNQYQDPCFTFAFPAAGLSNQQFSFRFVFTMDSNTDSAYVVPCTPSACLPMDTLPPVVVCNALMSGGCLYGGMGWYVDDVLVKRYNTPPVARFRANATADCLTKEFRDQSTDVDGTIVAWLWEFGDGANSTQQHPAHTYLAEGTYLVSLEVRDNEGARGRTEQPVEVRCPPPPPPPIPPPPLPPPPPPVAAFSFAVARAPCGPSTVAFTDLSVPMSAPIVSWHWEFGDGATDAGQAPTHAYAMEGTYRVVLYVTDAGGRMGAAALDVAIPPPAACGSGGTQGPLERPRPAGPPRDGIDAALAGADSDEDGTPDGSDSCPAAADLGSDLDGDGRDDACDADRDGDAIPDGGDLCPTVPDPRQADADLDGLGDACDAEPGGPPASAGPPAAAPAADAARARAPPATVARVGLAAPAAAASPATAAPLGLVLAPAVAVAAAVAVVLARRRGR